MIFQTWIIWSERIQSLKYFRPTALGCRDIEITNRVYDKHSILEGARNEYKFRHRWKFKNSLIFIYYNFKYPLKLSLQGGMTSMENRRGIRICMYFYKRKKCLKTNSKFCMYSTFYIRFTLLSLASQTWQ